MSNEKSMCYKCVRFRRDYNTGSISCRCHGFYPDRPHTMPKSCSNYEYDERKEASMTNARKDVGNEQR